MILEGTVTKRCGLRRLRGRRSAPGWSGPRLRDEAGLFESLTLDGFQSGLSWATVLRKRDDFRIAFAGFNPDAVAIFAQ